MSDAPAPRVFGIAEPAVRPQSSVHAASVFASLSLAFGLLTAVLTPPLRGPDETAHVVRALSVAGGDLLALSTDAQGRKGTWLAPRFAEGLAFFEHARENAHANGFTYNQAFRDYLSAAKASDEAAQFVRFEGSEGYSPIAYLPQAAGAWIASALGLGFLPALYLMRLSGVAILTLMITAAIARAGPFGWIFLVVAMLPSCLYGRSVVSADGMAFASALMVSALFLQGRRREETRPLPAGIWQALCALAKPPNLALVLLELVNWNGAARPWVTRLAIVTPAIALAVAWALVSSADVASWRLADIYGMDPAQFDPARKLAYLVAHPFDFPAKALATLPLLATGEFLKQVIGVLGLFDTVLQGWVYPAVALLVVATAMTGIEVEGAAGRRTCLVAGACALIYVGALLLIFYMVWTPFDAPDIWGVQGRYLLPVLPLILVATGIIARQPRPAFAAGFALLAAVLSGFATLEAILRVDWHI